MEILSVIGSFCSIASLFIALFVASKVINIENSIKVNGDKNTTAGRDVKIKK